MRKLMLTHADDAQADLLALVEPHYRTYAERHGYELCAWRGAVDTGQRRAQWSKLALIRERLADYDLILWVDCDFVVRAQEHDVASWMHPEDFQALVMEQTPHGIGPNTGLWLLRNADEAHEFLDRVWQTGPLPDAQLNDQATVAHLLGFSYLPWATRPLHPSRFLRHTGWLPAGWNQLAVFAPDVVSTTNALHFGGMAFEHKCALAATQIIADRLAGWETLVSARSSAMMKAALPEAYPHPDHAGDGG